VDDESEIREREATLVGTDPGLEVVGFAKDAEAHS
jgi:hypothetical protein